MHATFRAFRRPSPDELEGIWEDGIVVLDTSTLVDIFRYGPRTKHQLLELLSHLEDQLWFPYQVGLEFYTGLEDLKDSNRRFFFKLEIVIV